MELCDCGPHRRFPLNQLFSLELSINHFVFNNAEQVKIFQTVLASINSYATLSLSDLNLTDVASAQPSSDILIEVGHLVFDSVSIEFLEEFLPAIFYNQNVQILSFQRCVIPDVSLSLDGFGDLTETLQLLQLVDIPIDPHSLYNAIYGLTPEHVRFLRCGTVTDKLLKNLSTFGYSRIKTLELQDCSGFSSNGVREFVCARRDLYRQDSVGDDMFEAIEVHGTGPLLSVDDAKFFLAEGSGKNLPQELNKESDEGFEAESEEEFGEGSDDEEFTGDSPITRVEWNVVGHDYIPDGYTTDLRPVDAIQPIRLEDSLVDCPLVQVSKDAMYTVDADMYAAL